MAVLYVCLFYIKVLAYLRISLGLLDGFLSSVYNSDIVPYFTYLRCQLKTL